MFSCMGWKNFVAFYRTGNYFAELDMTVFFRFKIRIPNNGFRKRGNPS